MRVILASASPRRRELLAQIVPEFEVIPSDGEEIVTEENPQDIVTELAAQKAQYAAEKLTSEKDTRTEDEADVPREEMLVIGADTIVVKDGLILGKPEDEADAFRMLSLLSGETHQVYTGVCLIGIAADGKGMPGSQDGGDDNAQKCLSRIKTFYEETDVEFYPMSGEEIRNYIATGDPMDKAGAYGIQSGCARYVRGIKGDYNNVVGLPVARLYHEIENFLSEWKLSQK